MSISLPEVIKSIKEGNLNKEQLEKYSDMLSDLFADLQLEMADLEKEEALFLEKTDATVARAKVLWKATKEGQRLIVLKRYSLACKEMLNSLKSRTYRLIY
jgi:hypothetical protein